MLEYLCEDFNRQNKKLFGTKDLLKPLPFCPCDR